jgi:ABC-type multidrug transport system ATPase subunit
VIRFDQVTAHAAPCSLTRVSLELGPGLHALLGARADGAPLLLAVAAGWVRPRSGKVLVLGGAPSASRKQIAYVPLDARPPSSLRVAEALDVAAAIRGERASLVRPAVERLAMLGVGALADRLTQSLTSPESRAVLLAEALTSTARVLLIDEPLVDVDPRAAGALPALLRESAAAGVTVLVATSSPRDALDLSNDQHVLTRGHLAGTLRATDVPSLTAGAEPRLRVVSRDSRALLGALSGDPSFTRAELDDDALVLYGPDPGAMADAVARASLASHVELEAMHLDAPHIEELRAAAARRPAGSLRPPPALSVRPPPPPDGGLP